MTGRAPLPGWLRRLIQEALTEKELAALEPLAKDSDHERFDLEAFTEALQSRRMLIAERAAEGGPAVTKRLTSAGVAHFARRIKRAEGRAELKATTERVRIRYPDHPRLYEIESVAQQRLQQMERWSSLPSSSAELPINRMAER